jgi:threonine synthase
MTRSTFDHLECGACGATHPGNVLMNLCPECSKPLLARYRLDEAAKTMTPEALTERSSDLWRYEEVLPVQDDAAMLRLGEGWTPIVHVERLGKRLGCPGTYIKDESLNPTGSFKARGLCIAVSRAYELGATALAIPSAGNAAGAMSAYAAAAGLPANVFMPRDVPALFRVECEVLGAQVTLIDGLITDCGKRVAELKEEHHWFDVSTLKEPYRIEGKKTMGYELAEQLGWKLPDVILYPTGGGTGLIGMWKAFDEMETMGLIDSHRPRMVTVQSTGCAPIVRAFHSGAESADPWVDAHTVADGLRVPTAVGDFLMLKALRESNGTAVEVADESILEEARTLAMASGIFAAPEGAACLAAQMRLLEDGWIQSDETVVIFNTGTGLKYSHLWDGN